MRLIVALAAAAAAHLLASPGRAVAVAVPSPRVWMRRAGTQGSAADWPDFLAVVRSQIGAGDPLPDAVRGAARVVGGPFRDLDRAWGGSFIGELDNLPRSCSVTNSRGLAVALRRL